MHTVTAGHTHTHSEWHTDLRDNSCVVMQDRGPAVSDTLLFMDWQQPHKQNPVPGPQAAPNIT